MKRNYISEKNNIPNRCGVFFQHDVPVFMFRIDALYEWETIRNIFTLSYDHIFGPIALDTHFPYPVMIPIPEFFPQLIADAFDPITLN